MSRLREAVARGHCDAGAGSAAGSGGVSERDHDAAPAALCDSLSRGVAVAEEQGWLPATDDAVIVRGEAWQPAAWDAPAETEAADGAGMVATALALAARLAEEAPSQVADKPARAALGASAASNSAAVPSPAGIAPPPAAKALPVAVAQEATPTEL